MLQARASIGHHRAHQAPAAVRLPPARFPRTRAQTRLLLRFLMFSILAQFPASRAAVPRRRALVPLLASAAVAFMS
jgi:hypothetical protein